MSATRHHGPTRREQQIIDLFEGGWSTRTISRNLGIDEDYVRTTVRNLSFAGCWGNSVRFEERARDGNRLYVAALAAAGMCRA